MTPTATIQKLWNYCNVLRRRDELLEYRRMKKSQRYDTSHLPEFQFEPGSRGKELRERFGEKKGRTNYRDFFCASWAAAMSRIFFICFLESLGTLI